MNSFRARLSRPYFLWALAALIAEFAIEHFQNLPKLAILLPVIPAICFIVTLAVAIKRMDELQQRICLESVFVAFMLTLALTFVLAGLDRAGIYRPAWDSTGTPMMFLWACSYLFAARRYR
jgi:hypothetical protein